MRHQPKVIAGLLLVLVCSVTAGAAPAVEVSLGNGRASVRATNASLPQILDAWARAGRVIVINGTTLPHAPMTLDLVDVPEREALRTILRSASGYMAVERKVAVLNASLFERIVIVPGGRPPQAPAAPFSVPPPPMPPSFPAAEPDATGAVRLLDETGRPVPDDQDGAPPPPPVVQPDPRMPAPRGYSSGDTPTPAVDPTPDTAPPAPTAPQPAVPGMMPPLRPPRR
jgi:hypothetical protein